MKIRCERNFPENFVFGCLLRSKFDNFPSKTCITKISKEPEFKDEVYNKTSIIKNCEYFPENVSNMRKITNILNCKIIVKKDGDIHEYGSGM